MKNSLDKALKQTFDRRLFSSCGWSLTTSPSCWAAAFLVTGVVPVSSRINKRSSLKTDDNKQNNGNITDHAQWTALNKYAGSSSSTFGAVMCKDHFLVLDLMRTVMYYLYLHISVLYCSLWEMISHWHLYG